MVEPLSFLEQLQEAAARGVDVVIITGGSAEAPTLRFKWDHKVYRDCAVSRYRACGLDLLVIDMDGDGSEWELKRGRAVLAKDTIWQCARFYHFDRALLDAEAALLAEARRRTAALKAVRS